MSTDADTRELYHIYVKYAGFADIVRLPACVCVCALYIRRQCSPHVDIRHIKVTQPNIHVNGTYIHQDIYIHIYT